VRAQDHGWLHQLTAARRLSSHKRRLEQEGVSPAQAERGIEVIESSLHTEGLLTRDQLRSRLDDAGVPTARQALVHVLGAASLRGICVRGPVVGGSHAFVHADDWLGCAPRSTVSRRCTCWRRATSPATAQPPTATSPGDDAFHAAARGLYESFGFTKVPIAGYIARI